jgi:hypothetical protein
MPTTPTHREVEERIRRLVEDAELPPPDSVRYDARAVVFLWDESQLALVVDLDDPPASGTIESRGSTATVGDTT